MHRKNLDCYKFSLSSVMKNSIRFLSFLSFIFIFSLTGFGQTPSSTPPGNADNSITFEVRLPIRVTDKKKQLINGLAKNDFVVLEDGIEQEVTYFSDEKTNPPVYVGVLMDTSPSTAGKLRFAKQSAKDFIYTVLRLRKDKAAFMTFDHDIKLLQDFTDKQDLLDRAVEGVKGSGSQTSLYDAIWQFADEKLRNAPGRRVIVVITDGEDTFSRADLDDAIDIAQRTETTVFVISTKAGFGGSVPGVEAGTVHDKGDKDLVRLCEETGGRAFFTGDQLALERSFTRIREELRSEYILTYRPINQNYNGEKRKIEVRFANQKQNKDYKIAAKTGYNATRESLRQ